MPRLPIIPVALAALAVSALPASAHSTSSGNPYSGGGQLSTVCFEDDSCRVSLTYKTSARLSSLLAVEQPTMNTYVETCSLYRSVLSCHVRIDPRTGRNRELTRYGKVQNLNVWYGRGGRKTIRISAGYCAGPLCRSVGNH